MPQTVWWQLSSERKWFLPFQRWQGRSKVITLFTLAKALLVVKVKRSDGFSCAHLFWSPSTWLQIGDAAQDRCSCLVCWKSQLISGSESKWNSWGVLRKATTRTSLVVLWLRICLSLQGMWIWFLVRELKSHIPHTHTHKTHNKQKTSMPMVIVMQLL